MAIITFPFTMRKASLKFSRHQLSYSQVDLSREQKRPVPFPYCCAGRQHSRVQPVQRGVGWVAGLTEHPFFLSFKLLARSDPAVAVVLTLELKGVAVVQTRHTSSSWDKAVGAGGGRAAQRP